LNVIGGIESATGGQVVINGQNLVGQSPEKLATIRRDNIAFVFQFYNFLTRARLVSPRLSGDE
ncbi:MAG: hypothetical protein U0990_09125, partial [Candidatus Nanopelagicales bacterium]|nr:hypothetical protein [Candidatus Nanopelagicales bacterium]